ncbi:Transcriptional regulator [Frankia sp. AiPs1]|uniref:transcriptional regulator n=1 Tax=Frankia sp. AiPa1 TaxID=573492 RepID=UPI00202B0B5D|nr:transcriptional regulator [Frankia sp. AiPa1]MCL9759901.1 transcriptional regulator [Frankia sp. AiPa1]
MLTDNAHACTHPLAFVRAQRGWSYQRLARVVARRARDLGVANMAAERQKVWRWEHRGVVPDRVSQLALAAELGVPNDRLESHPWPAWLPTGDAVRTEYPWTPVGSVTSLMDVVEDALSDRRGFLTISGIGVADLASQWLGLEPAQLTAALAGGRVDDQIVNRIEHNIPGLRVMDERLGGESVRRLVDAELGVVADLLVRGSYTEQVGRHLHTVAAELARFAGWVSFDAGFHTAAQRYWITALHSAHSGGDRLLGANVLKNMSLQCVDFARPREAIDLAEAAVASVGSASSRVSAMLHMRLARAYAAIGETGACTQAIARSEEGMAAAAPEEPAWADYFDDGEFQAQVGSCYIDLGHLAQADRWLEGSLLDLPGSRARDRATYLLRRASVQMDLGNVDQGCALTREAMPMLEATRSKRNARRADELRRRLRRHSGDQQARELDQALARNV